MIAMCGESLPYGWLQIQSEKHQAPPPGVIQTWNGRGQCCCPPPPQKRGGSEVHKVPKDARTRMGKVIFKHGMASDCIILWLQYTWSIYMNLSNFVQLQCRLCPSSTSRLASHLMKKHNFTLFDAKMVRTRTVLCCSVFCAKLKHPAVNNVCAYYPIAWTHCQGSVHIRNIMTFVGSFTPHWSMLLPSQETPERWQQIEIMFD